MAIPNFVQASTGATDASGAFSFTGVATGTIGHVVICQILVDGTGAISWGTLGGSNINKLDGTAGWTEIGTFFSGAAAQQRLFIGRRTSASAAPTFTASANTSGDDVYGRMYEFSDVNTGTTLAEVIENGSAGSTTTSGVTTSATASDAAVTTLGPDRLALNFVGVNDDNAISAFTGETGGDWAHATAAYADAGGTDGAIALQVALPASFSAPARAAATALRGDGSSVNSQRVAQSFTTSGAITTSSVVLSLGIGAGTPSNNIVVEFQTDSAGLPSGTAVGSSATLAESGLTASQRLYRIPLSVSLSAGTTYWLVIRRSALDESNYASVGWGDNSFAGGGGFAQQGTGAGGTWTALGGTGDLTFAVCVSADESGSTIDGGTGSIVDSDAWGVVGFALIGTTTGGSSHTATPADTLALADARAHGRGLGRAESLAIADTFARTTVTARSVPDTLALADATSRAKTIPKAIADTLSLTDSQTRAKTIPLAPSDSLALDDLAVLVWDRVRPKDDSVDLADAIAFARELVLSDSVALADEATPDLAGGAQEHTVTPEDSLAVSDQLTRAAELARSLADTLALADSLAKDLGLGLSDVTDIADAAQTASGATRALSDTVTPSDDFSRQTASERSVSDSVALTDEATPSTVVPLTVQVDDSLALSDAPSLTWDADRSGNDTVALSDSFSRTTETQRTVADSVSLTDDVATSDAGALPLSDSLSLSDSLTRVTETARTLSDALALTDQATPASAIARTLEDALALADQLARALAIARTLDDSVALSDQATPELTVGGVNHTRQIDDTVALSDSVAKARGLSRADSLALADNFTRLAAYQRAPAESVAVSDLLTRAAAFQRIVTDFLTATDLIEPEVPGEEDITDTVALADQIDLHLLLGVIQTGHIAFGRNGSSNGRVTGHIVGGDRGEIEVPVGGGIAR